MTPRTVVRDAILDGVSPDVDAAAVRAIEAMALDSTAAACRNSEPLLDFDEYREATLL